MQITYRIGLAVRTISFAAMLGRPESDWSDLAVLNQVDCGKITTICAVRVRPGMVTTYSLAETKGLWPHWSITPTGAGRRLLVTQVRSVGIRRDEPPPNPCKIYVGGLHYDMSDASFLAYFSQVGRVIEAIVLKDKMMRNRSKGFGFVTFAKAELAVQAVQRFHDEEIFPEDSYDFTGVSDDEGGLVLTTSLCSALSKMRARASQS